MLLFLLLLSQAVDNHEPTVMARPQGAPYVFYKEDSSDEIAINLEDVEELAELEQEKDDQELSKSP